MADKSVAVIDIGSSQITVVIGERGVNNTFSLKGRAERLYEGFMEGRFFNETELSVAVKECVNEAVKKAEKQFNEIYLGVPGAFVNVVNKQYRLSFGKTKKIKKKDLETVFSKGQALVENDDYEVIGRGETYFALDDSRVVANPVGVVSSVICAEISCILCQKAFTSFFRKIFKEIKIKNVNFVYQGQAEGRFLLSSVERETPSLVMDVGYITSDINVFSGNGILAHTVTDFGGGILTFELVKRFGLEVDDAERLKRAVNIGFVKNSSSFYLIESNGESLKINRDKVNEAIVESVDEFIGVVSDFLDSNSKKFTEFPVVYLTGGGISYLRGIKSHLSSRFGENVEILAPQIPFFNKAGESSKFALLDYALQDKFGK